MRSNVLPFPVERDDAPDPAPAPTAPVGVQIGPMVGYNAIELTYFDAQHIPRIRMQFDTTVPQEMVEYFRKCAQRMGDQLPTLSPTGNLLLRPRLLP